MKIIKEITSAFGKVYFIAGNSTNHIIGVTVSPKQEFYVAILDSEAYAESLKTEDEIFFCLPMDSSSLSFTGIGGSRDNHNVQIYLPRSIGFGSLDQEYFDMPSFKYELVALTTALELVMKIPNLFKPFKLNNDQLENAFIESKAFSQLAPQKIKSLFTGKKYEFMLDPKYKNEDYVHNWLVTCNDQPYDQVWIAPLKNYITSISKSSVTLNLAEAWDQWLVKQYSLKLSLDINPEKWNPYLEDLNTYLDPIMLVE